MKAKKKHKRTLAVDISQKVKKEVFKRDGGCCIFCGTPYAMPNAHVIPRSKGGLGIATNIVTACFNCHSQMDNSVLRKEYLNKAKKYLLKKYPDWKEENQIYNKYEQ